MISDFRHTAGFHICPPGTISYSVIGNDMIYLDNNEILTKTVELKTKKSITNHQFRQDLSAREYILNVKNLFIKIYE